VHVDSDEEHFVTAYTEVVGATHRSGEGDGVTVTRSGRV